MTRKPVAVETAAASGPAHYWAAMVAAGRKGFTVRALVLDSAGVSYETVKRYVWFCRRAGHVEKIGSRRDGYATQAVYAVTRPLIKPPIERKKAKRFSARQAMWNAMRTLPQFSARELQATAATEEQSVSLRSAELYIQSLVAAGALIVLEAPARASGRNRNGSPLGARPGLYMLRRGANTGPLAPVLCKAGGVFDLNARKPLGGAKDLQLAGARGGLGNRHA